METSLTDDGIRLDAPDRTNDFMAAGSAAVIMAENIEARYGDDADFAAMLREANAFAVDVRECADEPNTEGAGGQFVDLLLLGMAASWHARTLERDHNPGADPQGFHAAAETMADAWDRLFRTMNIDAIGAELAFVEHRY